MFGGSGMISKDGSHKERNIKCYFHMRYLCVPSLDSGIHFIYRGGLHKQNHLKLWADQNWAAHAKASGVSEKVISVVVSANKFFLEHAWELHVIILRSIGITRLHLFQLRSQLRLPNRDHSTSSAPEKGGVCEAPKVVFRNSKIFMELLYGGVDGAVPNAH
jgi:hypothetical protein